MLEGRPSHPQLYPLSMQGQRDIVLIEQWVKDCVIHLPTVELIRRMQGTPRIIEGRPNSRAMHYFQKNL